MSEIWKWANLAVAFGMELVAVGALAVWGWKTGGTLPVQLTLAIGPALAAMVLWGLFAAPHAAHSNAFLAVVTKVAVLGGAAVALWAVRYHTAAVLFALVVVANLLIIKLGRLDPA
jgi:hypothetical protein